MAENRRAWVALIVGTVLAVVMIVSASSHMSTANTPRSRPATEAELGKLRAAVKRTLALSSVKVDVFETHGQPQRSILILNQPDRRQTDAEMDDGTNGLRIQVGLDVYTWPGTQPHRWGHTRLPFVLGTAFEEELGRRLNPDRFTRFDGTDYRGEWSEIGAKFAGRLRIASGYVTELEVESRIGDARFESLRKFSQFGAAPTITSPRADMTVTSATDTGR